MGNNSRAARLARERARREQRRPELAVLHPRVTTLHPEQPYIAFNDLPKIGNLSHLFPELYRGKPKLVADAGG